MMNSIRESLCDKVIRIFGFESDISIKFCEMAENDNVPYYELRKVFWQLVNDYNISVNERG